MGKGRLEAFSDGVIAIIITIMVLELKTPQGADLSALRPVAPALLSYLLSFIYIGIYWNNHHHMLHAASKVNGRILWANLHLLFWLSLVPFVTNWLGANGFSSLPVALYGIVLLMAGAAYFILARELAAHHGEDSTLALALGKDFKGILSLAIYAVAVAASFPAPRLSCALYVAVALMWIVPDRRIENRMTAALLLLAFASLPVRAAERAAVLVEDTVATVNGEGVMLSEYEKNLASTIAYLRRTNPAALADSSFMRSIRENTLEELVTRQLLVQRAKREKLAATEHDIDDAVEEIKGRFKEDAETGATLDDEQAERAFAAKLKADGVDYAQYRQSLTSDILARKVIARDVTEKTPPPSDEEARAYFDRISAYLASGSTGVPSGMSPEDGAALRVAALKIKALSSDAAHVERILIRLAAPADDNERKRALKTAQALETRLGQGADFEKVAREESEDPESAAHAGDIGYIVRGVAAPDLDKEAFALPVGRISEPILTDAGYNIIRVTERRAAKAPDFDRYKEDLKAFLDELAQKKALVAYLKALHEKAVVERRLPPSP